ncbi:hypothetical protein HRbin04_00485 [archaeon HR04]|nr:hypothetical protein HRbin04_00485 [archaeon HR04]
MPVEEWEKKVGKRLEEGLYRGLLRRGKPQQQDMGVGAGCALSEMHRQMELAKGVSGF